MHFPPAAVILPLAVSVNLRAATVIFGTVRILLSSVTVPTTTAILFLLRLRGEISYWFAPRCLIRREIESGGLLTFEETNLLKIVLAKVESVLLTRNLKSYTQV